MVQYKTIAGPIALTVTGKQDYSEGVRAYAEIIQREAVGGWELHCINQIPVTKQPGCIFQLLNMIPILNIFGKEPVTIYFNMLVFVKHD